MTDPGGSLPVENMSCRSFNLGDGMILIAALAVGLAFGKRATWHENIPGLFSVPYAASLCLDSLSVAVLLLRSRQPRPPLARMVVQPGVFACGTAVVCLIVSGIMGVLVGYDHTFWPVFEITATGGGVTSVWLMFWLGGLWKPEKGWIDGMGRFLGGCWIMLWLMLWGFSAVWRTI
jgi:hypothetical protein